MQVKGQGDQCWDPWDEQKLGVPNEATVKGLVLSATTQEIQAPSPVQSFMPLGIKVALEQAGIIWRGSQSLNQARRCGGQLLPKICEVELWRACSPIFCMALK